LLSGESSVTLSGGTLVLSSARGALRFARSTALRASRARRGTRDIACSCCCRSAV
jgi:hypothetical protein